VIENKEKRKLSWVVTGGGERLGAPIFSDKVLENYISCRRAVPNAALNAGVASVRSSRSCEAGSVMTNELKQADEIGAGANVGMNACNGDRFQRVVAGYQPAHRQKPSDRAQSRTNQAQQSSALNRAVRRVGEGAGCQPARRFSTCPTRQAAKKSRCCNTTRKIVAAGQDTPQNQAVSTSDTAGARNFTASARVVTSLSGRAG
jgi:hypothetical protein